MAATSGTTDGGGSDVTAEDARETLMEGYGQPARGLQGLTDLYNGITSFLAHRDQATSFSDDDSLPDDLDPDTRRQLATAETMLLRAKASIEEAAQERLNDRAGDADE